MRSREEVLQRLRHAARIEDDAVTVDRADLLALLEAPRGEAWAWAVYDSDGAFVDVRKNAESAERARGCGDTIVPLYAAPVAAVVSEAQTLVSELTSLLNRYNAENGSNTPDFILADFLRVSLAAFDGAVIQREHWYGRSVTAARGGA